MTDTETKPWRPSRFRLISARVLVVVGVLLTVISLLATYVKREALEPDRFRETSQELIASPAIQDALAAEMVEALYANIDISAQLGEQLPSNLQGLAGPIAGVSRELADRVAGELLARPRVQDTFVNLLSVSQLQLVKLLRGETTAVSTATGDVVLDLRPLVLELGDRFNFVTGLAEKIPPGSAQVTILEADNLKRAQNVTDALDAVANWIWVLAAGAWAASIWLARGRRREEVRAIGLGLVFVGILVLLARSLTGNYVVDNLVVSESVRPAASDAWDIITRSLADSGRVALGVGVIVAFGAWLTGPGGRATRARAGMAPALARTELAWAWFGLAVAVAVWILPIESFRTTAVLVIAAAAGFAVLRRQVIAESPDAVVPDLVGAVRDRLEARQRRLEARQRRDPAPSPVDELERLAKLKADGHLSEEEYRLAKARLLEP